MHLRPAVVFVLLLALFFAAVGTRTASRHRLDTPYFKGTSAMVYAHTLSASDGVDLDAPSVKANHPQGYTPSRYRADGFEAMCGAAFRAARFVSEVDGRDFARRATVFLAALCVFTTYGIARRWWDCQAAGLLGAFLVAFWSPLVVSTNGRVFTHDTLAPFFVTAHAALLLHGLAATSRRSAAARAPLVAAAAFVLAGSWEPGLSLIAIGSVALWAAGDRSSRAMMLIGHAVGVLLACALSPHLLATRAIGSWSTSLVAASAILGVVAPRIVSRRGPASAAARRLLVPASLLGASVVWWIAMAPVRAGAGEQFPSLAYLAARARHLFGKPEAAAALSDWVRHLWSLDHAPTPPHVAVTVFVPMVLLLLALASNAELRARRRAFVAGVAVWAAAGLALLVDRSILPVAAIAMLAAAVGAAHSLSKSRWRRAPLVALAVLVAFTGVVFRDGSVDASYRIARAAGVANRDPASFLWVSFENTDRELVRFVATRTSVRESILAPEDLSALLLAFTGRTVVALPGAVSRESAERNVARARAFYGSEEELFELCRRERIDYIVYSIDILLDTGRYSPRYLAGVSRIDPASSAFKMHFDPESLSRFTLLYENDHYRLFDVTGTPQPIFSTDHPPFYQPDLFLKANRDVDAFRQLAVDVMLTYSEAVKARGAGNAEGARRRLEWCLLQAPRYTKARLALADALLDRDRYDDARRVIGKLLEYAPDNTQGLYYAAFMAAQQGSTDEAKQHLTILFSIESDPEMLQRARALQTAIEQGIPLRRNARPRG